MSHSTGAAANAQRLKDMHYTAVVEVVFAEWKFSRNNLRITHLIRTSSACTLGEFNWQETAAEEKKISSHRELTIISFSIRDHNMNSGQIKRV